MADRDLISRLENDGYALVPSFIDAEAVGVLADVFSSLPDGGGRRHLIGDPAVHNVLRSQNLVATVHALISPTAFAFKATLFDKNAEHNWLAAWHRDLSIPVNARRETKGWSGWSIKDGVDYVHPPVELLMRVLAIRINIDDTRPDDGPLRVLPGTHWSTTENQADETTAVNCMGLAGDAVLLRPLILHASLKSRSSARRRVLHIEFSDIDLDAGLDWHHRLAIG